MSAGRNWLRHALNHGYAVPAFNYSDLWELLAIAEAARELKAPVYAASTPLTAETLGLDICVSLGAVGFRAANGALLHHLDHCPSVEMCRQALARGYHSVMYDGSALPLGENIVRTRQVVAAAHAHDVLVEAEVGRILGRGEEGGSGDTTVSVTLEDCVRMVHETGVDSLALGIGNRHGVYTGRPRLNVALLSEVRGRIDIPLVLHGGTGLGEEVVRDCITRGVAKVNVGTELHLAYRAELQTQLALQPAETVVSAWMLPAKEAVKAVVRRWICLCGADHRCE